MTKLKVPPSEALKVAAQKSASSDEENKQN
jgi:hypothetical protein